MVFAKGLYTSNAGEDYDAKTHLQCQPTDPSRQRVGQKAQSSRNKYTTRNMPAALRPDPFNCRSKN